MLAVGYHCDKLRGVSFLPYWGVCCVPWFAVKAIPGGLVRRACCVRSSNVVRILLLICFAVAAVGCTRTPSTPPAATRSSVLNEAEVLAIARDAVAANDTWVDRAEFDIPERQPDGSWRVFVQRLPQEFGGHRFISIDEQGKVTNYGRGL
jgi:hypothetical protein